MIVGWQGVFAGLHHMHAKGIVDQDIHLDNLLQSLDGKQWVKADLGNAAFCRIQPQNDPKCLTFLDFPL